MQYIRADFVPNEAKAKEECNILSKDKSSRQKHVNWCQETHQDSNIENGDGSLSDNVDQMKRLVEKNSQANIREISAEFYVTHPKFENI